MFFLIKFSFRMSIGDIYAGELCGTILKLFEQKIDDGVSF